MDRNLAAHVAAIESDSTVVPPRGLCGEVLKVVNLFCDTYTATMVCLPWKRCNMVVVELIDISKHRFCRVLGMLLRGVCLMRPEEIDLVFGGGCSAFSPAAWERFLSALSEPEQENPLRAYYARLTSSDAKVRSAAARQWAMLEHSIGLSKTQDLQVCAATPSGM